MGMPKWNELFKEVLIYYSDGKPHVNREAKINIADRLNLSDELRREKTEKFKENKIEGRVGFALSALKIAGVLEQYERGVNKITKEGVKLLGNLPEVFDEKYLIDNFESYKLNFEKNKNKAREKRNIETEENIISDFTPEELMDIGSKEINLNLANEILDILYGIDPYRFEYIVADLLEKMGYGDLQVTQASNDGGIDAIVNEDKLGINKILVQAKRYAETNKINPTHIRDFLGALASEKVQKGIFVTTSFFDEKSRKLASNSDKKLKLIDGEELAKLMIEYNVGTSIITKYEMKTIDTDYFNR